MTLQHVEVRRGEYHDSVSLLSVSHAVSGVPGVEAAQVAMATPLNLDVLSQMGFELPDVGPDDLVVAVRFEPDLPDVSVDEARSAALSAVESALSRRSEPGEAQQEAPRTTAAALRRGWAPLVLVSVPGPSAGAEAWDALEAGSSVMVFSDNVSVETEVALKRRAAERGLLVMGPDCGTAVVGGVGLGFANVVLPGPVSLVAASGTGAQQMLALLDAAGIGVRHCLGVGGRDLSAEVGGLASEQALRMLAADDGTELVVLVSKPPDPAVVQRLEDLAASLDVEMEKAVLGVGTPGLTEVADLVCHRLGVPVPAWPTWPPAPRSLETSRPLPGRGDPEKSPQVGGVVRGRGLLRGLFSGGTLCDEAMSLASAALGPVASNIPLPSPWGRRSQTEPRADSPLLDVTGPSSLRSALLDAGHALVDLGDDALTVGRAHPMIDPSLRLEAVAEAARDRRVRVLLLDVVLGHGAHPDPAGVHVPAIGKALQTAADDARPLDVVISLTGTAGDPQGRDTVAARLAEAGAHVYLSNAQATRAAVALTTGEAR